MLKFFSFTAGSILLAFQPCEALPATEPTSYFDSYTTMGRDLLIIGAGAIAGGLIANGLNHQENHYSKGSKGSPGVPGLAGLTGPQGPIGPTGIDTFIYDENQSLTFDLFAAVTLDVEGTVSMQPFVSAPDGTIYPGHEMLVNTSGFYSFGPIVVQNPSLGTYTHGFQIISMPLAAANQLTFFTDVHETRTGNIITILTDPLNLEGQPGNPFELSNRYTYRIVQ